MLILFVFACGAMIAIGYWINRRLISVISTMAIPYMIIIPLNNLIGVHYGFYKISSDVIGMLLLGLIMLFLGSVCTDVRKRVSLTHRVIDYEQKKGKIHMYNVKGMLKYVIFVEIVTFGRLVYIIQLKGFAFLAMEDYSGILIQGILGNLFLTIYPIVPVLFYYWLQNKKKAGYLIISLAAIALYFMTFVKYHSIGLIVLIFFFVSYEEKKYIKKGVLLLTGAVIAFFVGNYFFTFAIRGVTSVISQNYYINHLWNYISGSLIYDNCIFIDGIRMDVSIFYKLGTFIFPPVNIFLNAFFGISICPHNALPFRRVGSNGESGNVVDAIGYLFPSKGGVIDYIMFAFTMFFIGLFFSVIYNKALKVKNHLGVTICAFLTFFCFFSFFGTFYISIVPYKILLWSVIMLKLFDRRFRIRFGKRVRIKNTGNIFRK